QVGEYQKGHEYAQSAFRIRQQIQSLRGQISTLATLSGISFGLGLEEEAVAYAYEALDIAQRAEIDALIGVSSVIISEALLLVGRLNEALLYIQQHVAHSEKFGTAVQVAESRVMLGQFYLEQGDLETAVTHITPACSLLADGNVDSFLYPMNTFLVCIKILQALRDPQAVVLLQKSHELIQTRAALIRDNHLRQSYLQNVVVHRETIALYERNNQPV
ncbi:MAG: hypothetical protein GY943_34395, partial [Chloroflexi bacterium]|nr:hypothetical protein [Chloroflexota bacterium]